MKRRENDAEILQWCMDGCPNCFDEVVKPFFVFLAAGEKSIRASYHCLKCLHKWSTGWEYNFAIDHALDHMHEAGMTT